VVGISTRETEEDVASLTSSGEEESALAAETGTPSTSKTRSGKQYLKQYGQPVASSSQPEKETTEQSTKQPADKQKELRYAKALQKDDARPLTPFRFDVLVQLANIPARITIYELLRLSKSSREALREALADHEVFLTQIPAILEEEDDGYCHRPPDVPHASHSLEDMQIKGKHDRPLYYTRYIESSEVNHIHVGPGFALSIMPRRVMHHIRIPTHRLSATQTTIYGFNANGTHLMGKINLGCQIGDLKSEVTCYGIDVDTSYNLLLE